MDQNLENTEELLTPLCRKILSDAFRTARYCTEMSGVSACEHGFMDVTAPEGQDGMLSDRALLQRLEEKGIAIVDILKLSPCQQEHSHPNTKAPAPETREEWVEIINHPDSAVRAQWTKDPRTPQWVRVEMAIRDKDESVRFLVQQGPPPT